MKYFFLFLIFTHYIFSLSCSSTKPVAPIIIDEDSIFRKWTLATINIDVELSNNYFQTKLQVTAQKNGMDQRLYRDSMVKLLYHSPRYSGTAIFLRYNKKYFLVTARHLILDTTSDYFEDISEQIMLARRPTDPPVSGQITELGNGNILTYGGDHASLTEPHHPFLSFALSDSLTDLGVINLSSNSNGIAFRETLVNRGYRPIEMSDIMDAGQLVNGQRFFSFGFPEYSFLGNAEQSPSLDVWQSKRVSTPVILSGMVTHNAAGSNYFEGIVAGDKGCSGGPVVINNQLAGITSSMQRIAKRNNDERIEYFVCKWKFIKSSEIIPLMAKVSGITEYDYQPLQYRDTTYAK